ncbi:uncharacterized protein TEOVI_000223400 [Trypanosoma equiperdum]|uniref:Uncharacterized protein n=4 Tax=Trypanozoon TaxID=39700 RepID=Q57Z99_TRYB2|nr:hypothetical protein, conserved [Trypanosoma brucei gambiense DAL972]XP_843806.1 hypothetical protein, conserved [Trypanosoma brucei brucei TREU927]AAX80248.1 hypothetical protein, conserved [Trypanosoma brucei]RHW73799.1 hypothetical protein DPX39_030020200 [Trypanosoma brucei equiperdum]SCU70660.1 hypothetical protein, conserved [Trypanosoma equiperdum]AAZ10247.1 hypothetical protein, conserved [Trypanosoma brucei brucei TREU927]CBH09868.1 hypothetical protein, conserved [Trypanosoma bru|eukprot:XP_011772161.1 hypothetical protein, conserved [Trypanosoma brucei gambiense DAL972]
MSAIYSLLFDSSSTLGVIIVSVVPWFVVLLYYLYYRIKRIGEVPPEVVAPLAHFLEVLTDGATAGYDKELMNLFHPELLTVRVERGVVRAMVRWVCDRLGKVTNIMRDAVLVKDDGDEAHIIALVDFEKVQQVKCRMSWKWRHTTGAAPRNQSSAKTEVSKRFFVTAFRFEPHTEVKSDVLQFLKTDDFIPFAEKFVERLFERPPKTAVEMMVPSLKDKYISNLDKLQGDVRGVCGPLLGGSVDVNCSLIDATVLRGPLSTAKEEGQTEEGVRGIEMSFFVSGVGCRNVNVNLLLVFADLRCYVGRYEVRVVPDTRTQVIVDRDTGEKTFIG